MFLDTLASTYIEYTLQNQFQINENTLKYINLQLDNVTAIMDSIEYEIQNLRDEKGVLDINLESRKYFDDLMSQESAKRKFNLKVKALQNLKQYLLIVKDENILPPALYILEDDPYLEQSLSRFYQSQLKKIDLLYGVKKDHQGLEKLNTSIAKQRKDLLIYIENTIKAFREKISDVEKEIDFYKKLVKKVPVSKKDLDAVNRKLIVNEKLYTFLLEKRANTYIARSGIIPQTKVIEKSRIIGRVDGKSDFVVVVFLLIGIVIAIVVAIIKNYLFGRIENIQELQTKTELPILGMIPYVKNENISDLFKSTSKSNFLESLRNIRTALNFFVVPSSPNNFRSYLISSIHPGEGKTFTSINMSKILASSGKKSASC